MTCSFFFNDTATTDIYTLSLHDALPIYRLGAPRCNLAATYRPRIVNSAAVSRTQRRHCRRNRRAGALTVQPELVLVLHIQMRRRGPMKWSAVAAALVMAAAALGAQQPQPTSAPGQAAGSAITLRGCVRAGVEKDTVLMTDVVELAGTGRSA